MHPNRLNVLGKISLAIFLVGLVALPGSAAAETASTATFASAQQTVLIRNLEIAEQRDWHDALDPAVAPVTEEDFLDQMNKADRALSDCGSQSIGTRTVRAVGGIHNALQVPESE